MKWEDFNRWFNRDFWRAFKKRTFPIKVPETGETSQTPKVRANYFEIAPTDVSTSTNILPFALKVSASQHTQVPAAPMNSGE